MEFNLTQPAFSSSWWDSFIDSTKQMKVPASFKGCFSKAETHQMRMGVLEIIAEASRNRSSKYGLRLWVDGARDSGLESIFQTPPLSGEDIDSWTGRAFGTGKFGIILNRGEKFCQELTATIATKIAPLLEKKGMPTEGFLFTIFIGNYESTPLGIHKDFSGKSVMHFHLGPGEKTMYTWDDEPYSSRCGINAKNNTEIGPHLEYADKHTFGEGDVYFMPENRFHVGCQSGLSIGIACWSNNRSSADYAHDILLFVHRSYVRSSDLMLHADNNTLEDTSAIEATLDLYDLPEHVQKLSFKDLLRETYRDSRYALYSNCGFRNSPLPTAHELTITKSMKLCIVDPFKMHYRENGVGKKISLYVRGTRMDLYDPGFIRPLIDKLGEGSTLSVSALESLCSVDEVPSLHFLLAALYRYRGIIVVNEEACKNMFTHPPSLAFSALNR
jgi:hypothetical protein